LSVLDDMRQFKLADDEEIYYPHTKNTPISHKSKQLRSRPGSRSSVPNRTAARISARAQVDDIIASEGEVNPRIEQQIEEEVDISRITRLREMNKRRIQELERKLKLLQGSDGAGDEDVGTSIYVATHYEEPRAEQQRETFREQPNHSSTEEQTDQDQPGSSPSVHAHTRSPGWRRSSPERSMPQEGYTSDPGPGNVPRHDVEGAESDTGGGRASFMRAVHRSQSARQRRTTLEPFSFETRIKKKSITQTRFEKDLIEREELERIEYSKQFVARPIPRSTREERFSKKLIQQSRRSQEIREKSREKLKEEQRPFRFWLKAQEENENTQRRLKREIENLRLSLLDYGVGEARVRQIERDAWRSVQTDFTEAEQEERKMLKMKIKSNRKLSNQEEERLMVLDAEFEKKKSSRAYCEELSHRLSDELQKQETKFRSVPVPHAMMDMELRRMQQQEEERNYRKKDRKEKILSQSSLPPRMQKYQEEFGNRGAGRRGGAEGITAEHTFRPAPPKIVPDFKSMQKAFEDELAEYKSRNLSSMKKSELKPFFLRSEWVKFEAFAKFREKYEGLKVNKAAPESKLKEMNLSSSSSQWELIQGLINRDVGGNTGAAGLTESEIRQFRIVRPSVLEITQTMENDLKKLREERWPFKSNRLAVPPAPIPETSKRVKKPRSTGADILRRQAIQKAMKEKEEEKKRKEEEVREAVKRRQELWGMKDRVLNALAKGEEERRRENQKREEEMKMERRDFKNKTKEHQERLKGFYQNANERSLLMHSVARRLKQEVTKKFEKHLKAHGLSDLADELALL